MTASRKPDPDLAALPDMTVPFPGVCHPEIDRIEREALSWVARYSPATATHELEKTRAGRIVARTASPGAPAELLGAYGKMLAWGFWFDDRFVDDVPADSAETLPAIASVLNILDAGRGTGAAGGPMEAAFTEVVADLRQLLTDVQFIQWQIEMRLWLSSMCMQNALRISAGVPPVDTYKAVRRYTVCTYPCIVLIDACQPDPVGWADYHHPRLARLQMQAANIVAWQNDIFSFFSERRHPGRFWNLPALHAAHGAADDTSIALTAGDVAAELRSFLGEEAELPSLTPGQAAHLRSLRQWIRGCRDWSMEARERYFGWQPATEERR